MGLCGAALLIAARYHDIAIDAEEVASVCLHLCLLPLYLSLSVSVCLSAFASPLSLSASLSPRSICLSLSVCPCLSLYLRPQSVSRSLCIRLSFPVSSRMHVSCCLCAAVPFAVPFSCFVLFAWRLSLSLSLSMPLYLCLCLSLCIDRCISLHVPPVPISRSLCLLGRRCLCVSLAHEPIYNIQREVSVSGWF